jgi:3-oxoadipate CoA-transferase alpha subunit
MINKIVHDAAVALAGVRSGATVAIGGFGESGMPWFLLSALHASGIADLTIIANNAGSGGRGISSLIASGRVRRIICSYPRSAGSTEFEEAFARGSIELELVPQGTLSERLRTAAAGLGGFFTPTGAGTLLADGKEQREIDGRLYVFEKPLKPDVSLIHAHMADRFGNLTYHSAARNFAPVLAAAAILTIVEAESIVDLGLIHPEAITTPGIFVDRVVALVP